ncbi:methyltransferase domain-containing protein [Clostridium sp. MCC353]|uniref:class I SAM-dependent methyltransferase n=1 Tax=Clostridium sp. MCC353 TaxID=2592646 RepID=UPI001C027A5F|nr:class I SAM-dependent methyltransferase [Clostridium sp. MCC353]MBT9777521.1 methyltransferase domain-containing protein [Clostridium sp. MCC353]
MKENKYNDSVFFEKYSQMERSKKGLNGAGEWNTLERMLPDFNGKKVIDLGCGYGWHCIYAAEHGAAQVVGVDISDRMLEVAGEKSQGLSIEYICSAIEDIEYPAGSFDIVLSSLAFHYLPDFDRIAEMAGRILTPGGSFIFSAEHPVFTSQGPQDWYYGPDGEVLHFPVDSYFYEGKRNACFLGEQVIKYHRTLTTYLNGLLSNGFEITGFEEPQPTREMVESIDGMKDELRRPMMFIVSAQKK